MTATERQLTAWEVILLATLELDRNATGREELTAEEIVLASWALDRPRFGLRGCEHDHPDSHKVLYNLMGWRGLVGKGYLDRVGKNTYRLTPDGRRVGERVRAKADGLPPPAPPPPSPALDLKANPAWRETLHRLVTSAALGKVTVGPRETLAFSEACSFWGIEEGERGRGVALKVAEVGRFLDRMERLVEGSEGLVLEDGRCVTPEDVEGLLKTQDYLGAFFARHLALLGKERPEGNGEAERNGAGITP